jgi:hypothetical protein
VCIAWHCTAYNCERELCEPSSAYLLLLLLLLLLCRLLSILAAQQAAGATILLASDSPAAFSSITSTVYTIEEGTLHLRGR